MRLLHLPPTDPDPSTYTGQSPVVSTEVAEEFHKTSAVVRELGQVSAAYYLPQELLCLTIRLGHAKPAATRLPRGESYWRAQVYEMLIYLITSMDCILLLVLACDFYLCLLRYS